MAMPRPTPVEPSRSRCNSVSKMVRAATPVRTAALWATSCRACFLLFALRDGYTASGAMRSARSMSVSRLRTIQRLPAHPSSCSFCACRSAALPNRAPASPPPAPSITAVRPVGYPPRICITIHRSRGVSCVPLLLNRKKSPAKSVTRPPPSSRPRWSSVAFGRYMQGSSDRSGASATRGGP